jgi:hypothetical protein
MGAAGRREDEYADLSPVVFLDAEAAPSRVTTLGSLAEISERMDEIKVPGGRGVRTLVAGDVYALNAGEEAMELASMLGGKGRSVIVVDWSPDGGGALSAPSDAPGIVELIDGSAKFEEAIESFDESEVHFIRAGKPRDTGQSDLDPDRVNMILDALDEVYDHIVIVGRREAARRLFEAIQGRFDCGIVVSDAKRRATMSSGDNPRTFLGYEVDDITLIRYERAEQKVRRVSERLAASEAAASQSHAR